MGKTAKRKRSAPRHPHKLERRALSSAAARLIEVPSARLTVSAVQPLVTSARISFAELNEIKTIVGQAIASLEKVLQRLDGRLGELRRQECRVADALCQIWLPDGRPPPELNLTAIVRRVTEWFEEQKLPDPPSPDTIRRTLKKLGFR